MPKGETKPPEEAKEAAETVLDHPIQGPGGMLENPIDGYDYRYHKEPREHPEFAFWIREGHYPDVNILDILHRQDFEVRTVRHRTDFNDPGSRHDGKVYNPPPGWDYCVLATYGGRNPT